MTDFLCTTLLTMKAYSVT